MYKKRTSGWLKHWDFMLLDMAVLQISFVLAYLIRLGFENPYADMIYRNMAVFIELADIAIFFLFETLSGVLKRGYFKEFTQTLKHMVAVGLVGAFYLFVVQQGHSYSRLSFFIMLALYFVLSYASRVLMRKVLLKVRRNRAGRTLIIATTADLAEEVVGSVNENNFSSLALKGLVILDNDQTGGEICGIPVVADRYSIVNYVCRQWVDEVMIITSAQYSVPESLINRLSETGVVLHVNIPGLEKAQNRKQQVEVIGGYTVLTSTMNTMTSRQIIFKRGLDIAGGLVGSFITCILFIFIAPAIFIKSPGPIFYKQTRIGKNGRKFKMYKFRSMYLDADERKAELMAQNKMTDGMMFKLDFDPRVIGNRVLPDGTKKTGIGEFIRRTSLDEFPQFFNVLKGDMSLVGTRPPTEDEWEKYDIHHRARLGVKPGITGMWQVSGRSDITDFEEVVKLDTQYIYEWSPGLDLKILLKTVVNVVKGKGAV